MHQEVSLQDFPSSFELCQRQNWYVCRKVQEVQERLNAVQEELKREVAAAELARSHAMTVLRKQATLKEVT